MAGLNSVRGLRRPWFVMLSVLALGSTIAVGTFLWLAVELQFLTSVAEHVTQAKPLMSGLRFGFIAMVAIAWPILEAFGRRDAKEPSERWLSLHWRVVGWLVVVELVIGQDLIGRSLIALRGLT